MPLIHFGNGQGRQSSFRFAISTIRIYKFAPTKSKKTNDEVLRRQGSVLA